MGKTTAPKKKPEKLTYKIVAIGDSLTEGVGDLDNQGYVGATTKKLKKEKRVKKVEIQDFGHQGDTSSDLLKKLKQPQVAHAIKQSNTIFLTIGGNDLVYVFRKNFLDLHQSDFSNQQKVFSDHLNQVFTKIRRLNPNTRIYYFGLYNPFEDYLGRANKDFIPILNRWNTKSESIISKYKPATFIQTSDLFKGNTDKLLYTDHFHPNKKGYAEMSARLMDAIKRNWHAH
ncbi:GDSL-type esterase/lipase family protein [Sporolactobacillus kofuensis]|uniref:GDSL-type esterase/lipase family protein n=1 Tax=Sporolactobacillus kofuensis TaxID=269672 RepID=A0ABW1WI28_9BACL|nr:GDSL-type esterase/lipase family protein [Sporolactobacillus kofuensis]MCO7176260.1 GDSL-type esterase/lipase family protein [Sporolactobacillus kofuensis]